MHSSTISRIPHMPAVTATLRLLTILWHHVCAEMWLDGSGEVRLPHYLKALFVCLRLPYTSLVQQVEMWK